MNRAILSIVASSLLMFATTAAVAAEAVAAESAGEEMLPRDPDNIYGTFENGVQYIVRKTANPPGKMSLDLHVRTGALNETDKQNGIAHFLEHMAFKGSIHYEPGRLLPLLAHLGMLFGADTNAHTALRETVFKLSLPNTKPESIETALSILADDAGGLELKPEMIEQERGVILEELRSKRGAAQRLAEQTRKTLYAGTRLAVHDVMGDEALIKTFPQSEFQDYWNTWYQPANLTLIVAGDFDAPAVIAQMQAVFGALKAHGPARVPQRAGLMSSATARAIVLTDSEQVEAKITIESQAPARPLLTTYPQFRQELIGDVAEWIVNHRFADEVFKGGAPFRSASVNSGSFLDETFEAGASAEGEPRDWNSMLDATIGQIESALAYGFTPQELDLARRDMISAGEWSVKTESSQDSKSIVANVASLVGTNRPILSAQQRLDLTRRVFADLTPDQLHDAFVANFGAKSFAYILWLPSPKAGWAPPTNEQVLTAAAAAWAKKPTPPAQAAVAQSILAAEPKPGFVVARTFDEQLGLTNVVFSNGVVLHHKFNDYKKNQVIVQITLPGGQLEETAETKGVSSLASQILSRPATHRLSSTAVNDILVGKNVSIEGGIGLDALSVRVTGSPDDLPTGLQLAYAVLTDGALEQSAVDEWKKAQINALEAKANSARAQLNDAVAQTIYGGDERLSPLTADIIQRQDKARGEQWFGRIAASAAVEVAVVGDISADKAIDLVARYIGSLPPRKGTLADLDTLRTLDRPKGPYLKTIAFPGITPVAFVVAGYIGCDELSLDRRPLTLASLILTERMVQKIRVEDHLVYSIACWNMPGRGIAGTGMIQTTAPTDPKNADQLAEEITGLFKALASDGPTADELVTAKVQIANQLHSQLQEPDFWIGQFADLNYRHRSLSELKQVPAVFETFTTKDVRDVLRRYVTDKGTIRMAAVPGAGASAAK